MVGNANVKIDIEEAADYMPMGWSQTDSRALWLW